MCETPSLKGNMPTTSFLESAPSEGGVSKCPGDLVDLELREVWVSAVQHSLGVELPLDSLSLRPSIIGSWKAGCGFNLLSPTFPSTHPTPYQPVKPTEATTSTAPTSTITTPTTTIQTISNTIPATTIVTRTATGGTKVVTKHLKKASSPTPTYVCDGIGCAFVTNSPYKLVHHQSMPHNWKLGSQNWCFVKAKSLAQGNKPVGLKASGPTQFSSTDIRVKKGELPPNPIETK